ncbi:MAG: hypothetical protein ACJ8AU_00635 [Gemmatimonadales bacterium]|jgi:hypothetical protein
MTPVALEHERLTRADRLLQEIAIRHGVPSNAAESVMADLIDRFLVAYVPESRPGTSSSHEVEYAFMPSMSDALDLLGKVISESSDGEGAAAYIHDLDAGMH